MSDNQVQSGGLALKYKSVKELTDKLDGFSDWCIEHDRLPIIEWLYFYLDIYRDTAHHYLALDGQQNGEYDEKIDYATPLKRAFSFCCAMLSDKILQGKWRDAPGIFCLKNNYGYTDSSKIEVDSNITVQFRDDELAD